MDDYAEHDDGTPQTYLNWDRDKETIEGTTATYVVMDTDIPAGRPLSLVRQSKRFIWVRETQTGSKRPTTLRIPKAELLRTGHYQMKGNDQEHVRLDSWPQCLTCCPECNAELMPTPSGRCCPDGHGRLYPPAEVEHEPEALQDNIRNDAPLVAGNVQAMCKLLEHLLPAEWSSEKRDAINDTKVAATLIKESAELLFGPAEDISDYDDSGDGGA